MNLRYQIIENDCSYELVVYDSKNEIKSYKYTDNIIEILENDNVIELLNGHIGTYDEQIKRLSILKLFLKREKITLDYLHNACLGFKMKNFALVYNSKPVENLVDKKVNVLYNFNSGIDKVKEILSSAKSISNSKAKKLIK